MHFRAYCRTSTSHQHNSFATQLMMIQEFIKRYDGTLVEVLTEISSGGNDERPVLQQAVEACVNDESYLIVSTCDRLARSCFTIARLNRIKRLNIVCCEFGTLDNSQLMMNMKALIAEEERKLIRQRIKATIAKMKAEGRKLGNQNLGKQHGKKGNFAYSNKCKIHNLKVSETIRAIKQSGIISYSAISRHLNKVGFSTVNSRKFSPSTVRSICLRYSL